MILHVFDDTFTYRGRVENWINMTWTEEYKGEGGFTLVTYDTDAYAEILRHGWYFYRTDRPAAMMAVKVERDTDKNTITVCGYSALHFLSRRIIDNPHDYLNVEAGIYEMINQDLRGLTQIATAAAKGLTEEYECTVEGVIMLDGVLSMLNESNYGIRANFDYENKRHVIEVYEGVDRTYDSEYGGTVFSQEFGNLRSLVVTEDDDLYKNVAYVTGSANNDSSTVYYQYVSPEAGEKPNWREMLVRGENQEEDESNEDWRKRQKQIAKEALQEHKNGLMFEVDLPSGIFGKKYDLGDAVTCKSRRYGLQFDTRIMEYHYSYKKGVESVKLTLGNKPLGYVEGVIAKRTSSGAKTAYGGGGSISTGGGTSVDVSAVLSAVYPVGAIYMSVNSTSPAALFGGTWERIKDRFLLGAGDSYTLGNTGGEAVHALTVDELAAHSHGPGPSGQRNWVPNENYSRQQISTGSSGFWTLATSSADGLIWGQTYPAGSGIAHNNMPPYLAVYVWKRTA